jgi:hypothetical protein
MQVRCVRAFGQHKPGDLSEVPDDAAVCPDFWEPATATATGQPAAAADPPAAPEPAQARTAPPVPSAADITPKEGA